jgi:hypothetical protein
MPTSEFPCFYSATAESSVTYVPNLNRSLGARLQYSPSFRTTFCLTAKASSASAISSRLRFTWVIKCPTVAFLLGFPQNQWSTLLSLSSFCWETKAVWRSMRLVFRSVVFRQIANKMKRPSAKSPMAVTRASEFMARSLGRVLKVFNARMTARIVICCRPEIKCQSWMHRSRDVGGRRLSTRSSHSPLFD